MKGDMDESWSSKCTSKRQDVWAVGAAVGVAVGAQMANAAVLPCLLLHHATGVQVQGLACLASPSAAAAPPQLLQPFMPT